MMGKTRILAASIFGNALEFYNLTLYGFFVSLIAEQFFPPGNHVITLVASLSVYAIGFVVRPLGAVVFGHIGDKFGRRRALGLSISIMGIPAIVIAFLPSYNAIGVWAPTLLIMCRVVQGLCSGGEFNGATIFALEHLGKRYPGFAGGLIVGSCLLGSLLAVGAASFIQGRGVPEWAWRVAFFLGGSASFYGLYMRRQMEESPDFALMKKKDKIVQKPLKTALSKHLKSCLLVGAIAAFDGALTYSLVTFLSLYMTTYLLLPVSAVLGYNFFGVLACMLACPLAGWLADRFGVFRVLIWATGGVLVGTYPVFWMLKTLNPFGLVTANILLGLLVGSVIGVQPLFSQKLFPPSARYTGIAFSYSLSLGVFGGLTPVILTYGVGTQQWMTLPAYYLMVFALFFGGVLWRAGRQRLSS